MAPLLAKRLTGNNFAISQPSPLGLTSSLRELGKSVPTILPPPSVPLFGSL